jgi:hypothetical protein
VRGDSNTPLALGFGEPVIRRDNGSPRRAIYTLSCTNAQHGLPVSLDAENEMSIGT